ncbi:MAG: 3-keto-disaccharide hydrolase [Planctomycetota bacterium]
MMHKFVMIGLMMVLLLSNGCGTATEDGTTADEQGKKGFVPLFNGSDLAGWKGTGGAKWVVRDRAIVGTQGENNAPGDLFTEEVYADFELKVTYKVEWPCNSGVWFRYQSPDKAYQADILEYKNPVCYSGTLYCPGKMFLAMNTDKSLVDRDGWNTIKVRAEGDHIQIWINDHQVADVHDDTTDSGRIGFQIHAGDHFGPMKIIVREVLLRRL